MGLDRVLGDLEAADDVFVGEAVRGQGERFGFAGAESVEIGSTGGGQQQRQPIGVEYDQAGRGGLEGGEDLKGRGIAR